MTAADPSSTEDAREAYLRRVLADAPPLSDEQRHRVAALLRPVASRLSTTADAPPSTRRSA